MATIDQLGADAKQKPGIPCIESRQLANALSASDKEQFTYEELSLVIGANVQSVRGYLLTARDIVLREKGYVFRPMRNIGLRRLSKREVAELDDRFSHVRRTHKKTIRELKTVDIAELPEPARISCVAKMALAHMTVHTHSAKQVERLESAVGSAPKLDLARTLQAFKESEESR